MFSIQTLFSKGDKFQELLEISAMEAHESVRLAIDIIRAPAGTQKLDDLVLSRRKQKKISEQITEELVKAFITGLEREDIEALARMLYKIQKTAEKLAEHYLIATPHLSGVNFARQTEMVGGAADVVLAMVKKLRQLNDLQGIKELNDKLQYIEAEADAMMMELLRDLYSGKYDPLCTLVVRDLYELVEKLIDRCRDVGSGVMEIVLKNS